MNYTPSSLIKKNTKFLLNLAENRCSLTLCKKTIKEATSEQLLSIVEICLNILRSRFPINKSQKKLLQKKANLVRKISRLRSEKSAKQVFQKGEGIPAVAALVASFLVPILSDFVSKKLNN